MDLPSLPTDSLYKFMALSGIALVLFAVSYPPSKAYEVRVSAAEATALSEKLNISIEEVERNLAVLERIEKPTREEVENIGELHLKTKLDRVDVRRAIDTVKVHAEAAQFYLRLALMGVVIGFALMMSGFALWYFRVQRYLDKAIAKDGRRAS